MGNAILKTTVSDVLASNFLNTVLTNEISVYLAVGRNDSSPWDDEDFPPVPKDSLQDEADFRSKIIGIKKVNPQQAALIFKKVPWQENIEFFPLDPLVNGPQRATNWYCVTTENKVFQCIDKIEGGLTTAGSEPSLMGPEITTPDGYVWKFLFDINPSQLTQNLFIGNDWLPIGYNINGEEGGTITSNQKSYGDVMANFTIGSFRLLFNGILEDENQAIPYSISYRQIGLIVNPRNSDNELLSVTNANAADFDINSGQLIYLENRAPIYREPDTSESIKVVISF